MMAEISDKSLLTVRAGLLEQTRKLLDSALSSADTTSETQLIAKTIFEVWGMNMGVLDAILCLRGVSRDDRLKLLRQATAIGKALAASDHKRACKGCDNGAVLEEEIQNVH